MKSTAFLSTVPAVENLLQHFHSSLRDGRCINSFTIILFKKIQWIWMWRCPMNFLSLLYSDYVDRSWHCTVCTMFLRGLCYWVSAYVRSVCFCYGNTQGSGVYASLVIWNKKNCCVSPQWQWFFYLTKSTVLVAGHSGSYHFKSTLAHALC